jgi:hypothetical protein
MRKYLLIYMLLLAGLFAEDYAGLSGSFLRLGMKAPPMAIERAVIPSLKKLPERPA